MIFVYGILLICCDFLYIIIIESKQILSNSRLRTTEHTRTRRNTTEHLRTPQNTTEHPYNMMKQQVIGEHPRPRPPGREYLTNSEWRRPGELLLVNVFILVCCERRRIDPTKVLKMRDGSRLTKCLWSGNNRLIVVSPSEHDRNDPVDNIPSDRTRPELTLSQHRINVAPLIINVALFMS